MTTLNRRSPDRLRGALIGFGFIMERGHAAAYRRRAETQYDVEIVAIADICKARREEARIAFPLARIYDSHTALLFAEARTLDFVDIATPPASHAAIAMAALDAGVHVLCEKPLCTSVADADAMLARAHQRKRVLFPCHNYRHAPVIKAVRDILDSNVIGRVHMVTLQTFRNTHARGVAEWEPDWRRHRRHSGGGIAMDHGSHSLYLLFDWLASFPTTVSAHLSNGVIHDTEEDFNCTIGFPAGYATVHLTWTAGVRKVMYTLHGEKGSIRVEDDDIEVAHMRADPTMSYQGSWEFERTKVSSNWMDSSHVSWFNSLFDDFRVAIAANDYVSDDLRTSRECVRLIESAYKSAAQQSRQVILEHPAALAAVEPLHAEVDADAVAAVEAA
ncbi:MAG: Gfo/Idh/MocA family oxidoreductase [Gemmatimonadaceae bacterium]